MPYLDTSAVIPLLMPEPSSASLEGWIHQERDVQISGWTCVETASALGIKVRTKALSTAQAQAALDLLRTTLVPSFAMVPVDDGDIGRAGRLLERFDLGLRAGDALHLAIAQRLGTPLVTLDRRLATAAAAVGLEVIVPG